MNTPAADSAGVGLPSLRPALSPPHRADVPVPDPTRSARRLAQALALPFAFLFQAGCNALFAWATRGAPAPDDIEGELSVFAAHPTAMTVATVLALIGCLLAVAGLPCALRVLRPAVPRLALIAVALMIGGYVCYVGPVFSGFDSVALGSLGPEVVVALEASPRMTAGLPFLLLFVAGNLLGAILLGIAVLLGGRRIGVPRWAGLLLFGWPVGHVVNMLVADETFAVIGGLLQVAGLLMIARAALRLDDREWAARG